MRGALAADFILCYDGPTMDSPSASSKLSLRFAVGMVVFVAAIYSIGLQGSPVVTTTMTGDA